METIIKYFGKAHVDWILAEGSTLRCENAKSGAWMANNLEAFRLYDKLLNLMKAG